MRGIHEGHEQLMAILDDQLEKVTHMEFDEMILARQDTEAPLYAVMMDEDDEEAVTIFRADHAPSTTALARQLRQLAAAYRQDDDDAEAAAEEIADGGGHSLH